MSVPKLTLDTNLLHEHWKERDKADVVEKLLRLAKHGKVELAVTARVREDIPRPPLADELNELPELQITERSSLARLGYWVLGRDMLGNQTFEDFRDTASQLAKTRGKTPPDWRDWDHIHAHYLLKRDAFLTWDEGILCLSEELKAKFGITVVKPDDYLQTFIDNEDG